MKFSLVVALLASCLYAKTVVESVSLKSGGSEVDVSEFQLGKQAITISLQLSSTPEQVSIALKAQDKEVIYPAVHKKSKYEVTLPSTKIPDFFKTQDLIEFELIAGDSKDKSLNLITKLFDLKISEALKSNTNYSPSLRYGPLLEIHHIFRAKQSFVNPIVPVIFIGVVGVLFLILLSSWGLLGLQITSPGLKGLLFGATLVCYEFIFIRYYISDSIFVTIGRVALLTPFSVILGSRVLRTYKLKSAKVEN